MSDPIELFDYLQPPAGWSDPIDISTDPVAARILDRVFADDSNVIDFVAARRRRRGIGGAIVVAALVAGGAVAAVWNRSPDEARELNCWSEAIDDPPMVVGLAWDGTTDPADLCALEWSVGSFAAADSPDELQACITDDATVAVVPGDRTACDRLGLPTFSAAIDDAARTVAAAERELARIFLESGSCVPPAEAAGQLDTVLDKHGLTDWDIKIDDASSVDEICASFLLDATTSVAKVIPVPRPD